VSDGSSWKLWNTKPTFSPRTRARPSSSSEDIGSPSSTTLPLLGTSRPAINASRVLLPEPDAPTIATEADAVQDGQFTRRQRHAPAKATDFERDRRHPRAADLHRRSVCLGL
jgi:hypothetical protein